MPRYFFHVQDTAGVIVIDEEGIELPNVDAARREAILGLRDILVERLNSGELVPGQTFIVSDDRDRVVAVVPVDAVLKGE
jgi:hypothetical protein